ncbi:MAG: NAD(P)-dependent glycerol-3-phosphate dehydrogenase [Ruminococcaceae bacterium]|nr:NAD(P)-dependent glycerol-3-phosphate dehydrogenase [Oscillospiraceae bacterium]
MSNKIKIGVLGAGTWGVALARMLCLAGNDVTVWSAIEKEIDELSTKKRHPNLADVELPESITYTKDIKAACTEKDILLFAVPSPFVRATARKAAPYIAQGQIVVDVAKGIEEETLYTMTQILADELKDPSVKLVALSGPTHAEEVVKDLPTTIVSASSDTEAALFVQKIFTTPCMRVYTNDDVLGVEICGALKNVIALASGIALGLGCGDNTKAALITRGIAEISRLGIAMGCREQTFGGLAGIGDLIVTATSIHSRNLRCGILLGQGVSAAEATQQVGMVVEGLNALPAALSLARKYNVEMPIIETVDAVVSGKVNVSDAIRTLMSRDLKSELNGSSFNNKYD